VSSFPSGPFANLKQLLASLLVAPGKKLLSVKGSHVPLTFKTKFVLQVKHFFPSRANAKHFWLVASSMNPGILTHFLRDAVCVPV